MLFDSDSEDEYLDDDPTQQSAAIQLPSDECIGCGVSTKLLHLLSNTQYLKHRK